MLFNGKENYSVGDNHKHCMFQRRRNLGGTILGYFNFMGLVMRRICHLFFERKTAHANIIRKHMLNYGSLSHKLCIGGPNLTFLVFCHRKLSS
jgi:hypothetical protein